MSSPLPQSSLDCEEEDALEEAAHQRDIERQARWEAQQPQIAALMQKLREKNQRQKLSEEALRSSNSLQPNKTPGEITMDNVNRGTHLSSTMDAAASNDHTIISRSVGFPRSSTQQANRSISSKIPRPVKQQKPNRSSHLIATRNHAIVQDGMASRSQHPNEIIILSSGEESSANEIGFRATPMTVKDQKLDDEYDITNEDDEMLLLPSDGARQRDVD